MSAIESCKCDNCCNLLEIDTCNIIHIDYLSYGKVVFYEDLDFCCANCIIEFVKKNICED